MLLINVRHNWPERPGYPVAHVKDNVEYLCLHFYDPVRLTLGEEEIAVPPSSFIVISPEKNVSYTSAVPYRVDKMYLIGNLSELMGLYGLAPNTLYPLSNSSQVTAIMEMLEFEFYQQHVWSYRYMDIKIEELLIVVSTNLTRETTTPISMELSHRMKFIRQEMMAFPERNWSVKHMASRIGVSESRLYPLYKSLFGISPNRDLVLTRIERAKQLLKQGVSLTETAERSGYHNIYHFIRQFEKETHFTPHQYAIRHR